MPRLPRYLLFIVAVLFAPLAIAQDGYTYGPSSHFSTGKLFMGREIANVVDITGAEWFDRDEREEEEGTARLLSLLDIGPNDVIADVGAGTGYVSFRLSTQFPKAKIYAEDIQKEMLQAIRKHKRSGAGKNVNPVLGTETDLKLPAGSVDLILLVDVYHEMQFPREMGESMMRALKAGGRVAMVELRGEDPDVAAQNLHKMTETQARLEMGEMGFYWLSTDSTTLPRHHVMIFGKK